MQLYLQRVLQKMETHTHINSPGKCIFIVETLDTFKLKKKEEVVIVHHLTTQR